MVYAYHNDLDQLSESAPSDTDGNYAINGLAAGCYEVQAFPDETEDYHISGLKRLYLGPTDSRTLDFELGSPGYTISGTVRSGGSELAGVTVEYDDPVLGIEEYTTTDGIGYYEFNNLPPGRGEIGVHAYRSGLANTGQDVDLTGGGEPLTNPYLPEMGYFSSKSVITLGKMNQTQNFKNHYTV